MDALSGSKSDHSLELCIGVFTDMSSKWEQVGHHNDKDKSTHNCTDLYTNVDPTGNIGYLLEQQPVNQRSHTVKTESACKICNVAHVVVRQVTVKNSPELPKCTRRGNVATVSCCWNMFLHV
jgi:hypothetical protein